MTRIVGAPRVTLKRCLAIVGGDERLARLLFALYRWSSYTQVIWDGRHWVTLSYAEWAAELAISRSQFKYVLEKAARRGLVHREQHKFRGSTPLFLRLTEACRADLLAEPGLGTLAQPTMGSLAQSAMGTIHHSTMGDSTHPRLGKSAQPLSNSDHELLVETELAAGAAPPPADSLIVTAAEAAAKPCAYIQREIGTLAPDKVSSLEYVWQLGFARRGTTPPALSMKGRGQMRRLIELWSEGQAPLFLAFALENWASVRDKAELRFGAFDSPREPELGYLVRYAHVVADLMARGNPCAAARRPVAAAPLPPLDAPTRRAPAPGDPAAHVPATLEEVLAIDAATEGSRIDGHTAERLAGR